MPFRQSFHGDGDLAQLAYICAHACAFGPHVGSLLQTSLAGGLSEFCIPMHDSERGERPDLPPGVRSSEPEP